MIPLLDRGLVFVTGKGGVGKTTVAAALGHLSASSGRRTIVCEVGQQQRLPGLHRAVEGAPGEEVPLADGLWATSIDPDRALREWLERQVAARPLVELLSRSQLFQYFVAAAPGARELVTVTKLWELGQAARWKRGAEPYDVVVADLPASGHGLGLLRTARTFADIARVGPIARQAGEVRAAIADPARSAVLAVALAAEMPVSETLELEERAPEELERPVDAIVVNDLVADRWSGEDLDRLGALDGHLPAAVARAARAEHGRARVQQSQLKRLRRHARAPVLTLPHVGGADLDLDAVEGLAGRLGRQLG